MKNRESFAVRSPSSFSLTVGIALALLACSCASKKSARLAGPPPVPEEAPAESPPVSSGIAGEVAASPQPDHAAVERLYEELADVQSRYVLLLEQARAGEAVDEEALGDLTGRLRDAARDCARMKGCDLNRFFDAMSELLTEQGLTLTTQAFRLDALTREAEEMKVEETDVDDDLEREPGTSPFVATMPDLGDTVSLLRGTDLRDIIRLNGPVKAAIDDWLTWRRPMLLDAYENYEYLRDKIAPIYEEAGLPEALLFAMIATETGGKAHAYSHAGAAGILQFMPHTGRVYGLKTVDGFDLRLDPEAATRANVAYLNDRFEELNDSLEKALAAYNAGEHRIRRLNRRYREASFWDSRIFYHLPRETRDYVPSILAAAWLFLHPEEYNLELPAIQTETTELVLRKDVSLGELSICLGQVESRSGWFRTLRNLNPRLTPGERIAAGKSVEIPSFLVPYYEANCLDGPLIRTAGELHDANYPFGEVDVYVVRRGDTLGRIASRIRCASTREIAEINDIRPPRYVIRVGQRLRIPACP